MCTALRRLNNLRGVDHEDTAMNLFLDTDTFSIPIDIESVLEKYNIPVSSEDFSTSEKLLEEHNMPERIQGQVHVQGNNISIYYNPNASLTSSTRMQRKRFTLAHELAHCILHTEEVQRDKLFIDYYRIDGYEDDEEYEVNALAGAILMPKGPFIRLYNLCKTTRSELETLQSLSILFKVSKTVVKARIEYLGL